MRGVHDDSREDDDHLQGTTSRLRGRAPVTYRVEDPRIRSATPYQKDLFVHHFRVDSPEQLDDQFARWIADAYDQVGSGNRLRTG